jgi:hypothetical protein
LAEIKALEKQAGTLKTESACIEACYTHFNAKKKAILKFEKEWDKKKSSRPKKRKMKVSKKIEVNQPVEMMLE